MASSSIQTPLLVFSTIKTTSSEWHHRLGHPSESIVRHIVSRFGLEISDSISNLSHCDACQCNKSHKLPSHLLFRLLYLKLFLVMFGHLESTLLTDTNTMLSL